MNGRRKVTKAVTKSVAKPVVKVSSAKATKPVEPVEEEIPPWVQEAVHREKLRLQAELRRQNPPDLSAEKEEK